MKNVYKDNNDGTTTIFIKRKNNKIYHVLIDTAESKKVLSHPYKWCISSNGTGKEYVHAIKNKNKSMIKLHRFIMNEPKGKCIDHINGNTMDNRKSNLSVVTIQENLQNRKINSNNKVGYHGVSFVLLNKKYRGSKTINGERRYTKLYEKPKDAYEEIKLWH